MTVAALIEELSSLHVDLTLDGDQLRVNAPRGVLTPELKARIRQERDLVVALLASAQQPNSKLEPIRSHPAHEPAPLTSAQNQLWFLEQLDPGASFLNVPLTLRLNGKLDLDALSWVVTELGRRHDVLCSEIVMQGDEPQQLVDGIDLRLEFEDYSHLDDAERERTVAARRDEELSRPFDLEARQALIRFFLFRVAKHDHVLVIVAHHVLFDGSSQDILLKELKLLYEARVHGLAMPTAPRVRFADYARWQCHKLTSPSHGSDLEYWRKRLAGMPIQLELPTDRPRPRQPSHAGHRAFRSLDRDLTTRLRRVARSQGATLNMLALASIQLLLWRYSGQSDFGLGLPLQNRNHPDCEDLIGMFVSTLVLRAEVGQSKSFADLLARVRDSQIEALSHRDVAFEDILQLLATERTPQQSSLFQVLFSYQEGNSKQYRIDDLETEVIPSFSGAVMADMVFWLRDHGDCLWLATETAADLFDAETTGRLFRSWQRLLEAIADDPALPLNEVEYIDDDDRRHVVHELNDTAAPWDENALVHRLFERVVDARPDDVGLIFEDQSHTYRELDERANRLAHALVRRGIGPNALVGLCVHKGTEQVVAMLGVLKAGGAYVGLDPTYPNDRLSALLEDSQAGVLISSSDIAPRITTSAELLLVDRDAAQIAEEPATRISQPERADQLAYIIYTSGSTGKPKGVMAEHRNATSFFAAIEKNIAFDAHGVMLAGASISFDMSVIEILASLCQGRRLVVLGDSVLGEALDARYTLPELVSRHGVTHFQCTPSQAQMLLLDPAGRAALASLEQLLVGGEALAQALADELCAVVSGEVINVYGPTETTVYATTSKVEPGNRVTIGRPIPNTVLFVLDAWGKPVPKGAPGELFIGGPGVSRGYLARPELTAQRYVPNTVCPELSERLYRSGDLVRYAPDGTLIYLGRNDHQVKVRGYRIELGEIESALRKKAGVIEAVVVARGDGAEKRLVGYLVADSNFLGEETLRAELRRELPEFMVPPAFVMLDALPLNSNGKVDRARLPEPAAELAVERNYVAPRDERERKLCEVWQRALGIPHVGVSESFFDLGGHSLLAVKIVNDIERSFGVRLPLATLFECPTVELFAKRLSDLRAQPASCKSQAWTTLVPIQPRGTLPPFFCVAGVGGNPMNLRHLATALGEDQPFYGLQFRGVDGQLEPHRSVQAMAEEFLADVRRIQPQGPYFLGGYSAGGLCAYEMAQLLRERGENVGQVVFFDTLSPRLPEWTFIERVDAHIQNYRQQGLQYLPNRVAARVREEFARLARALRARLAQNNRFKYRHDAVWLAAEEAIRGYVPEPYAGDVLLVRADARLSAEGGIGYRPHESNGWRDLVRGELKVIELACSHRDVVNEEAAALAAKALKKSLATARSRYRPARPSPGAQRRSAANVAELHPPAAGKVRLTG